MFGNKSNSKLLALAKKSDNLRDDAYASDSTDAIRELYRFAMSQNFDREVYAKVEMALGKGKISTREALSAYEKITSGYMSLTDFAIVNNL